MEASHRRHANANTNSSISSAASSCSITSGTPSTDMRFAEYQLDKIVSHFTPDDDDPNFIADRPIRAYSVGSRLEHNKRKLRVDMLAAEHCNSSSRVRAFSVGSKAKVARSDLYRGTNLPSNLTKTMSSDLVQLMSTINNNNNHNHNNNNIIKNLKTSTANNILNNNIVSAASKTSLTGGNTTTTTMGTGSGNNKKSLTAPTLSSMNSKANSIDPMDDLMEIDFTKKDDDSLSNDSSYDQNHASCDDLMEIDYPQYSSYGSSTSSTGGGGGGSGMNRRKTASMPVGTNSNSISTRASQPVPITTKRSDVLSSMMPPRQGYSFEQIEQQKNKDGYMNMKPVGSSESRHGSTSSLAFNKNNSSLSSSPAKSINGPPAVSSPAATHRTLGLSRTAQTSINTNDYLNMSPISTRSNQSQVNQAPPASVPTPTPTVGSGSAPEGYMEMSWGKLTLANASNNNNNNASLSSISSSNEYINMNFSGNIPRTSSASSDCSSGSSGQNMPTATPNRTAATSNCDSRTNRMRSMPITIRTNKLQATAPTQPQQIGGTLPTQHTAVNQPPNHHPQSFAAGKMFPPSYLNINAKVSSALTQSDSLDEDHEVTPTAVASSSDASSQHSAAIFPFSPNSPNSGTNKQIFSSQSQTSQTQQQLPCEEQKRKCLVDGTTGE